MTKPMDMVDEPDEGDGGVYDDGGGCEDRVVPGEGGELLVAGGDGVEPDGGGGDGEESGVGGGELADAGGSGEVDGTGVESSGGGEATGATGGGGDSAGGGDVSRCKDHCFHFIFLGGYEGIVKLLGSIFHGGVVEGDEGL
ncbi:hypothetical protein F0562_024035 [Nyssa sinensis]|uniref:Uncharacterized protein n=1 Tax=Nyssa sinensis TaxID=561372 RepID=A0A5J5BI94_9ASTE|nr:hypothetical protein F0562_024035 [Nyssa sinensis]